MFKYIPITGKAIVIDGIKIPKNGLQVSQAIPNLHDWVGTLVEFKKVPDALPSPRRGFLSGSLKALGIVDVVQSLSLMKKSGVLHLNRKGKSEGTVTFDDGEVVAASADGRDGREAFFNLTAWEIGSFSFEMRGVEKDKKNIEGGTTSLLLEAMRRVDEDADSR